MKFENEELNQVMQQVAKQYQEIFDRVDQFKEQFGNKLVDQVYNLQNDIKKALPKLSESGQKEHLASIQDQHLDGMKVLLENFVKDTSLKLYNTEKSLQELLQPLQNTKKHKNMHSERQEPGWSDFTKVPQKKQLPQKDHKNLLQDEQKKINRPKF